MTEKILTTEQVANILQVHPFTILKFIKQGKLKGMKLGRVYRIKESDVEAFIEERMTKNSGETKEKKKVEPKSVTNEEINNQLDHPIPKKVINDADHYFII